MSDADDAPFLDALAAVSDDAWTGLWAAVDALTAIVRSERFGDGSIEGALRRGTLQAAVARLRADYG